VCELFSFFPYTRVSFFGLVLGAQQQVQVLLAFLSRSPGPSLFVLVSNP